MTDQNLTYDYATRIAAMLEGLADCANEYRAAYEEWEDDKRADDWEVCAILIEGAGLRDKFDDITHLHDLPEPYDVEDALNEWWDNDILDVQVLADVANGNRLHEVRAAVTLGGPNCWVVWDGSRSWIDCRWGSEHSTVSVPAGARDFVAAAMESYADDCSCDY